jgi:hypothetical protein
VPANPALAGIVKWRGKQHGRNNNNAMEEMIAMSAAACEMFGPGVVM